MLNIFGISEWVKQDGKQYPVRLSMKESFEPSVIPHGRQEYPTSVSTYILQHVFSYCEPSKQLSSHMETFLLLRVRVCHATSLFLRFPIR